MTSYGKIAGVAQEALTRVFGDRLSFNHEVRAKHGADFSRHTPVAPDAVAFAQNEAEVSEAVKICAKYLIPIIPFGAGTSVEGHVIATHGGLTIDLSGMNTILSVEPGNFRAVVQPGVTREALNDHLRDQGMFFPVDPGANATLGGMTATRASGTSTVRYGTMRENVLGMRAVMPDGQIMKFGTKARKSSAGYDLTRLMIGSEGTLGLITEVTLVLSPIPEEISAAVAAFDTFENAIDAAMVVLQSAIPVARIEFLDTEQIRASNAYSKLDLYEGPTLFLEFHGSQNAVREQAQEVQEICKAYSSHSFDWAMRTEDRNRLWKARHDAAYAANAWRTGCKPLATDVCVPLMHLQDSLSNARKWMDECAFPGMVAGHLGDGNYHAVFLIHPDHPDEMAQANAINARIIEHALSVGGTCSGEHGIGLGKIDYLSQEAGNALQVMQSIKRAIDPQNLMNPGKIFCLD